jgi:perosamine synthetase
LIYLSRPFFDEKEVLAVTKTLNSGWVAGQGPKGEELASIVQELTQTKYAIPINNCTAGLHLALLAIGIKAGDEVLVSDYTFPATGHSVMYCGAKPVFVDVDLASYNMDPDLIEQKITKRTKAIIVVHALGQMAEMDRIMEIAKKHNLKIIEDAACAFGAKYKNKPAGNYSDIAVFSFHARKNATSGEGGIVVTNNEVYSETIKSLSCFGMESAFKRQGEFSIPSFEHLGFNYKLSDINAAIVIEQINKYDSFLIKKRELASHYNTLLRNNKYLTVPFECNNCFHIYQTYAIVLDEKINRNKLILSMGQDKIQTQIGTYASYIQPVYNSSDFCPNSLFLFNHSIALPFYYELTEDQIKYVVERLISNIDKQIND